MSYNNTCYFTCPAKLSSKDIPPRDMNQPNPQQVAVLREIVRGPRRNTRLLPLVQAFGAVEPMRVCISATGPPLAQLMVLPGWQTCVRSFALSWSLQVVVLLESGGGEVTAFGLAAAKLARLKDSGFKLTVCVDKVRATLSVCLPHIVAGRRCWSACSRHPACVAYLRWLMICELDLVVVSLKTFVCILGRRSTRRYAWVRAYPFAFYVTARPFAFLFLRTPDIC